MQKTKVTVRVPATTANFGPAYDIMGMALNLWLEVTVEASDRFSLTMEGQGSEFISTAEDNMVVQCTKAAFEKSGVPFPTLKFTLKNDVPFGCGCGSSSAAAVAGALAGFVLCGQKLRAADSEELLQVASDIEGHPDNAAPAIYGGIQMGLQGGGRFHTHRIPTPPNMWCVLFVPKAKMKVHTSETRKLIPTEVSMTDAVHNMARSSLLVLALSQGNLDELKICAEDRFHQQQRRHLFPHMQPAIDAAFGAGASYAFLSGAGPTVCAFVKGRAGETTILSETERLCDRVGKAMYEAARIAGVEGKCYVTFPADQGAHVSCIEPSLQSEVFVAPAGL